MAAPEHVPSPVGEQPRVYQSPPRRLGSWTNDRPGDFTGRQPVGPGLGSPGPDQGYVLKLARQFEGQLHLAPGEHEADAMAGCIAVALKRASLFGRAPVVHDLTLAFAVWGYLGEGDDQLIARRRPLFEECNRPHHYQERRRIADSVPESVLRMTPAQVRLQAADDWRTLIVDPGTVPALGQDQVAPSVVTEVPVIDDVVIEPEHVTESVPLPDRTPASEVDVEAESDPAALPDVDVAAPVEEAPAIHDEPIPGVEVSTDGETTSEDDLPEDPMQRKAVKPVPLDPQEVAALARKAKVAFQKQANQQDDDK